MIHPIVRQGDLRQVRNHLLRLLNLQGTWASNQTKVFPSTSRVYEPFFMNLPQKSLFAEACGEAQSSSQRQVFKKAVWKRNQCLWSGAGSDHEKAFPGCPG